ncbi:MAG: WXG100 family type VII secretion target [Lachnospiraceae bacterium]
MAKKRVNTEDLKQAVFSLKEAKKLLDDENGVINQIAATIAMMEDSWDGNASIEFLGRLRTELENLKKLKEVLDSIQSSTEKISSLYDEADRLISAVLII